MAAKQTDMNLSALVKTENDRKALFMYRQMRGGLPDVAYFAYHAPEVSPDLSREIFPGGRPSKETCKILFALYNMKDE